VRLQPALEQGGVALRPLLQKLGAYFEGSEHRHGQAPAALLEKLDSTLRAVCAARAGEARQQAAALASMRRDLFPRAAAYQPEIAS
jgi:hypothetical protein